MPGGYKGGWEPLTLFAPEETIHADDPTMQVWANKRYQVLVRTQVTPEGRTVKHLSIHSHDRGPVRNWRHLQQMKNECCGEDWTGVEMFPPEAELTDTANEYHLFCFPPDAEIGIGLSKEDAIVTDDETAAAYTDDPSHQGRQEPWEPGLTTGRTDASAASRERMRALGRERYDYDLPPMSPQEKGSK
jgi:hypothetical protein